MDRASVLMFRKHDRVGVGGPVYANNCRKCMRLCNRIDGLEIASAIGHGEDLPVAARPGEKIVFVWQVWPDKTSFRAAEERMHEDPRMDSAGEPPFDAGRLILGCFKPIATMGRKSTTFCV